MKNRSGWARYLVAALFITAIAAARYGNSANILSFSWLYAHITDLTVYVQAYYTHAVLTYILSYIAASVCALPGSTVFIMAGGLLFGVVLGSLYALIGAVIGSSLLFLVSRYVIGSWVQERYAHRFTHFNDAIEKHGYYYLLMVRVAGIIPFFVVNVLSGITVLSLHAFVGATAWGMLPSIVVYAFIGQQLTTLQSVDYF